MSNSADWAEEAADIALGSAAVAQKAAAKVLDSLPKPDPRDDINYQRLSGLEQSTLARISPRHRNRWPELQAIEERVVGIDAREEELHQTLIELRQRRERADAEHSARLAEWMAAGEEGARPVSEATALDAEIAERQAEYDAMDSLRDRVLEEKIAFVHRHRKRLVKDVERAIQETKQRYLESVNELEQARDELIGLNETRVWAALFGDRSDLLRTFAPTHALVGARQRETQRHVPELKGGLAAHAVLGLLRADAEHFAAVATVEQAAAMQGVSKGALTQDEAMWANSDEDVAWQKREKERLIEIYEQTWGHKPAEFG